MRECAAERYPVTMDAGWQDWDLDIAGGPASGARILIASENHGADKLLLRVRAALVLSPAVCGVIVGGTAAVALAGLIFGSMTVAAIFVLFDHRDGRGCGVATRPVCAPAAWYDRGGSSGVEAGSGGPALSRPAG